jgi:5-methylcytosine-specific restriction endonuclease McrA
MKTPLRADALAVRSRRILADHRTRAKRAGAVLDYTLADVRALLAASPLCHYCNLPLSFAATLDHRQPIARSGKHALANLAVCCPRCNRLKGVLTEVEFHNLREFLKALPPRAREDVEARLLAGGTRYAAARRR